MRIFISGPSYQGPPADGGPGREMMVTRASVAHVSRRGRVLREETLQQPAPGQRRRTDPLLFRVEAQLGEQVGLQANGERLEGIPGRIAKYLQRLIDPIEVKSLGIERSAEPPRHFLVL